ncbi:hypothetical protein SCALM49S_01044 [Streptomyces californicus]
MRSAAGVAAHGGEPVGRLRFGLGRSAPRAAKSSPYDSASVKAVRRCTQPPWVAMSPPSPIRLVTTTAGRARARAGPRV